MAPWVAMEGVLTRSKCFSKSKRVKYRAKAAAEALSTFIRGKME